MGDTLQCGMFMQGTSIIFLFFRNHRSSTKTKQNKAKQNETKTQQINPNTN